MIMDKVIEILKQSKKHHLPVRAACHFALTPSAGEMETGGCKTSLSGVFIFPCHVVCVEEALATVLGALLFKHLLSTCLDEAPC